ncbi:MAG: CBS domain-containing protein [Syntrophales bacterium]|jgi:CBS domain-containing protein|nr:CBS domain-containing protein [Syntrophales bacterium]
MLKAQDIMTTEVITVKPDTEILQAAKLLLDNHINGLPVVDDQGHLKGIICQADLIKQQKRLPLPSFFVLLDTPIPLHLPKTIEKEIHRITATKVSDVMTPQPITVRPDSPLEDIATLMVKHNIHTLIVMDGSRLAGIIGKEDILKTLMPSAPEK